MAASRCADSSAIWSPRRSSSWTFGGEGTKVGRVTLDSVESEAAFIIVISSGRGTNYLRRLYTAHLASSECDPAPRSAAKAAAAGSEASFVASGAATARRSQIFRELERRSSTTAEGCQAQSSADGALDAAP